jgi:hypothetical protein
MRNPGTEKHEVAHSEGAADHALDWLSAERLAQTRRSFSTRRVHLPALMQLLGGEHRPQAGDLVLARVVGLGHHRRLELPEGRRSQLYIGDEIIVVYGHRYAPDQFEAEVPDDLDECHLVAAGGIAARLVTRHSRARNPTQIQPLGLLGDEQGRVLNVADWRLDGRSIPRPLPPVIAVAGSSMNAGKTTAAARLIKGLHRAGKRVGAAKVTGTGAGGDLWQMRDAGAVEAVDFTDAGHASTYLLSSQEVEKVFMRLLSHLGNQRLDAIVIEIADGLLQTETASLLDSPGFAFYCDRMLFAAGDSLGAVGGVQWLQRRGIEVCALSVAMTASPLAAREASSATGLPVLGKQDLADPAVALDLLGTGA